MPKKQLFSYVSFYGGNSYKSEAENIKCEIRKLGYFVSKLRGENFEIVINAD